MFEKIHLKNFQRHENRTIEFDPAITVFVGPSDRGKSAIIRALRWVCLNRAPRNHIRFGSKYARATLIVDGHKIIRGQGQENIYLLDGKPFRALRKEVPEEIQQLLNVDDSNFQRQLDPLFWITLPTPQAAKALNDIVDLSIIDRSLSKAQFIVRESKSNVNVSRQRIKEFKAEVEELSWVEEAASDFKALESLMGLSNHAHQRWSRAVSLGRDVSTLNAARGNIDEKLKDTEELLRLATESKKVTDRLSVASSLLQQVHTLEDKIWSVNKDIQKLEAQISQVRKCPLCGAMKK